MKILIVCSKNSGKIAPFIVEQAASLERMGHSVDFFTIEGKGIMGYLNNYGSLLSKIKTFRPDIIHAHYGLSGLLANLQRRVPVVTTYHGSDINNAGVYRFSKVCMMLSACNVFVSEKNRKKATRVSTQGYSTHRVTQSHPMSNVLIPCGVDVALFVPMDKDEARKKLGLDRNAKYILFAGAFDNKVKNAELAKEAIRLLSEVTLLELKGYQREEVVQLMNAVDGVLMTSFTEGSPQFIKEAMACNCPVVSVAVGDVPEVIANMEGCFVCKYDANDIADKIRRVFTYGKRTNGREVIASRGLELVTVAKRIIEVYQKVVNSD